MNGGNAVALYFTAENIGNNSAFPTATFAGQPMTALTAQDTGAGAQTAQIFYLVDPTNTVGVFEVTMDPGVSSIEMAYSQISLGNVGSVAGTDAVGSTSTSNGTPLDVNYTTATNGGFVLGAAVNNDYNGARPLSVAYGNPDTDLLSFVDVGTSGHFHTYGDVPTAGPQTDGYYGQYQRTAIATVAFETADEFALAPLSWAAGSGDWDINGTANWSNNVALVKYVELFGTGPAVTFDDTASGGASITVTLNTTVNPISVTISNSSEDYTISGSGDIGPAASLTKEGSGTLTLGTVNTYSGGSSLNGGTTVFSALDNLGTGNITFDGGTLQYNGNTDDISSRTVTLAAGGGTIDIGASDVTFANAVGNGGAGGLTKKGSGTLELDADNVYHGDTVVSAGTLYLATELGASIENSPVITVNSGATLDVGLYELYLNGAIGQKMAGTGTVDTGLGFGVFADPGTFISPATNGVIGTLTFGGPYGDVTLDGATLQMDVSSGSSDTISIGGYLYLTNSTLELNVIGGPLPSGTHTLISGFVGVVGNLGDLTITGYDFTSDGQVAFLSDATPGQIDLVIAPLSSKNLVWAGTGTAWDVNNTSDWLDGGLSSVFLHGDSVTFDATGAAQPVVSLDALVFPGAVTVNANTDYTINDGGGFVSGTNALTKSGSGKLTINTPNNNSGGTTINAGTVEVGGTGHIGSGDILNNGTLILGQTSDRTSGGLSGSGSVTRNGSGTVTLSGGATHTGSTIISAGTLQIGNGGAIGALQTSSITNGGTLGINSSSDIDLSTTPITGTGGLVKGGTGTLQLGGSATFEDVSLRTGGGSVIVGAVNQIQGDLSVNSGASLDLDGFDLNLTGINSALFSGGTVTNSSPGSTNTITVNNTTGNDASFDLAESTNSPGVIALVKQGAGELNWRGIARTYSGGTTIEEGIIRMSSATPPFGTGPVRLAGGGLFFDSSDSVAGYGNTTYLLPPVGGTTNTIQPARNTFWDAPLVGTADLLIDFSRGGNNDTLSISGGSAKWAQVTNTVYLRGSGGWLRMSTGSDARNVTWDLSDGSTHLNSTGSGDIHLGALVGNSATAEVGGGDRDVYLGNKNLNSTYAGRIAYHFNWIKVGTGNQTFTGTNTCDGSLTVSNGTLTLSGAAAPTNMSAFTVASPGILNVTGIGGLALNDNKTLAGDGTVVGDISVTGTNVTIEPGFSPGILNITGNLTLTSDASLIMELDNSASPTSDQIAVTGSITSGGASVTVTNIGPLLSVGQAFTLFNQGVSGLAVNIATNDSHGSYVFTNRLAQNGTLEVLAVTPFVDQTETNLNFSVSHGNLTLEWPASHTGWTLQAQTNTLSTGLSTNWVDLGYEGTNSVTFPVDPASPAVFYRLTLP